MEEEEEVEEVMTVLSGTALDVMVTATALFLLLDTGPGEGDLSDPLLCTPGVDPTRVGFSGRGGGATELSDLLSGGLGFSTSSLRKLERSNLVLSATEGGLSGRGGAGPLPPPPPLPPVVDVAVGSDMLVATKSAWYKGKLHSTPRQWEHVKHESAWGHRQ